MKTLIHTGAVYKNTVQHTLVRKHKSDSTRQHISKHGKLYDLFSTLLSSTIKHIFSIMRACLLMLGSCTYLQWRSHTI
jgi:hypothetical protein